MENLSKKWVILCDMDEVLCDFVGGALKVHGWTRERFLEKHPKGQWSIVETLGLSNRKFWGPINALGGRFWKELQPTEYFKPLVRLFDHLVKNELIESWYVVTTPSLSTASYLGKVQWVRHHLGSNFSRLVLVHKKSLLANPRHVLIDDREQSIQEFVKSGGQGIVFPAINNSAWAEDPFASLCNNLNLLVKLCLKENSYALSFSQRQ